MTWKHLIKTSTTGLSTNRSRSILTIFGIVIGITSIMLVMSLGAGAQNLILGEVQGLGTNTIAIIPGQVSTSPSNVSALYSDSSNLKTSRPSKTKQTCRILFLLCRSSLVPSRPHTVQTRTKSPYSAAPTSWLIFSISCRRKGNSSTKPTSTRIRI